MGGMTTDTTNEAPVTTYQSINSLVTDGSPFHAALTWHRLGRAADAVTMTLDDGLELELLLAQINNLRSDAWTILWNKTAMDPEERQAALDNAREHLHGSPHR